MSSLRQVQQGRPYQLPPRAQGIAPSPDQPLAAWQDTITRAAALAATQAPQHSHNTPAKPEQPAAAAARSAKPQTLLSGATRAYLGVSPALVEELCLSAGVLPTAEPSALTQDQWQALYSCWQSWLTKLHSKAFNPCSCSSSKRFSVLGSYPDQHSSVHDLLDGYYFSLLAGEVYGGLYQRLAAAVKVALKKARGRVYSFEQQLSSAVDSEAVQKQGDIIVANLYRWVQLAHVQHSWHRHECSRASGSVLAVLFC
jgi:predicted ribosome quality control (RQC) complex YloA/Tae2 family protein